MTAPPPCVETDLQLHQTAYNGLAYPIPAPTAAVLRWRPDDPWAVELDFADHPPWWLGWELLEQATRQGGRRTLGEGDVRISRASVRHYEITLASPSGSATFAADAWDLVAFVEAVRPRHARAAAAATAAGHLELRALLDGDIEENR